MRKTEVSIIIPTYKPGNYIWSCLDSICRQTISKERIELVVVVNGCNEPYVGDIKRFLYNCGNLQYKVLHTDVPGVSKARNMGLSVAKGEWVSFIDDDDWVSENYFEELLGIGKDDAHIVEANVANYDEVLDEYRDDYLTRAFVRNSKRLHVTLFSARSFMSSSCCKLIRRSIIGKERFDCSFERGEDALFMAKLSKNVKVIRTSSSDVVYYRRLRNGSASRKGLSVWERLRDNARLAKAYTLLYVMGFPHYNALFFATRFCALARNCLLVLKKTA